tara:strand:+ start:1049 stop:1285 length:237 start_codon:yes stop_codon:yes gene_type:complete
MADTTITLLALNSHTFSTKGSSVGMQLKNRVSRQMQTNIAEERNKKLRGVVELERENIPRKSGPPILRLRMSISEWMQ